MPRTGSADRLRDRRHELRGIAAWGQTARLHRKIVLASSAASASLSIDSPGRRAAAKPRPRRRSASGSLSRVSMTAGRSSAESDATWRFSNTISRSLIAANEISAWAVDVLEGAARCANLRAADARPRYFGQEPRQRVRRRQTRNVQPVRVPCLRKADRRQVFKHSIEARRDTG